jgi:hypothetical protein
MEPKPSKPMWLIAISIALMVLRELFSPAPAPEPIVIPAPVVTVDPTPKPQPKPIDWIALIKTLIEVVPRTEPLTEPAPTTEVLVLEGDRSVPGLGQIKAKGTWTKIEWMSDTPYTLFDGGRVCVFSATQGSHVFYVAGSTPDGLQMAKCTMIFGPETPKPPDPNKPPPVVTPDPTTRPTKAVYVFEQRQGSPPPPVLAALSKLNVPGGLVASSFDQSTLSGKGQIPAQYVVALEVAKREGLPILVVQAGDQVLRFVKAPKTAAEVEGAVK